MLAITPLFEQKRRNKFTPWRRLPSDLVKFLLYDPEIQKIKNRQKLNILSDSLVKTVKEQTKEDQKNLSNDFINTLALVGILKYNNDDIAFFSFRDKHIYDWNSRLKQFNALVTDEVEQEKLVPRIYYTVWTQLMSDGKKENSEG